MRAVRKTAEEQYQLILECRRSGMSDCDWCRKNGINPETFYTWIKRLRKKGGVSIPPSPVQSARRTPSCDIVQVDVLPKDELCAPSGHKNTFIPPNAAQQAAPSIEIQAAGAAFRFNGVVDASLYEKTLLMIGGRL